MNNKTKKSEDSDYIKILLRDKEISDQIINHSRSMISLIDNSYVYVKVNAAFCNAHQVINNLVEGKSLSDVWGDETFNVIIKSNVDLCFTGSKTPGIDILARIANPNDPSEIITSLPLTKSVAIERNGIGKLSKSSIL